MWRKGDWAKNAPTKSPHFNPKENYWLLTFCLLYRNMNLSKIFLYPNWYYDIIPISRRQNETKNFSKGLQLFPGWTGKPPDLSSPGLQYALSLVLQSGGDQDRRSADGG